MKKNIIRTFVIFLSAVLGLSSCSDYMDVKSQSNFTQEEFYTSESNMDRALIGVYGCLKPFSKYYFLMSDLRSDNMFIIVESKKNEAADCSQLNTSNLLNDNIVYSCWSDHYKLIVAANQLIDNLDKVTYTKSTTRRQLESESRFLRALSYFDLVRYYGNIPVSLHTITLDESFALGQSTPKEVYENAILPDLYFAADSLMAEAQDYLGTVKTERVSRIAAKALLAKAYLQMSGYPVKATTATFRVGGKEVTVNLKSEAQRLFGEVIDEADVSGKYWAQDMDEWNRMFLHENDNKYYLFEIQYALDANQGNPMTPLIRPNNTSADSYCGADLCAGYHAYIDRKDLTPHFISGTDKREFQSINTFTDNGVDESGEVIPEGNRFLPKFFEHKLKRDKLGMPSMDANIIDRTYWPQNYPIIRLEDVMLLYAELAGEGDVKARVYLNKIRSRAGLPSYTGDFQEAVKMERRYELVGEGVRWFDEVRQNTYVNDLKAKWSDYATRLGNDTYKVYANRVNANSLYYPIPLSQMRVKEGLYIQNPGY